MKNRKHLLKSEGYWIAKWQLDLFAQVEAYKRKNNITNTELAKLLNVTKGYVSQLLNGNFNHKISSLIHLALVIGKAPVLTFQEIEEYIEVDARGYYELSQEQQIIPTNFVPGELSSIIPPISPTVSLNNSYTACQV